MDIGHDAILQAVTSTLGRRPLGKPIYEPKSRKNEVELGAPSNHKLRQLSVSELLGAASPPSWRVHELVDLSQRALTEWLRIGETVFYEPLPIYKQV